MFEGRDKGQGARGKGVAGLLSVIVCALVLVVAAVPGQASDVRDPTRPPQMSHHVDPAPVPVRRDYVLQSTRVAGDLRSAVINGRVVSAGDRVDGALVVAVDVARVRLRDHHGEFTLRLAVPVIARPAQNTSVPGEANP